MSKSTIIGYESGSDHTVTSTKDISETEKNNTLPVAMEGHLTSEEYANILGEHWAKREKKSGQKEWFSPFDHQERRQFFTSKSKCMDYIKKHQSAQLELWQHENPHKKFSPLYRIISPKRRLEDLVMPGTSQYHQAAVEVAQQMSGLVKQTVSRKSGVNPVFKLLTKPENLAIQEVRNLSNDDLEQLHRQAANRGKRGLAQAIRREMKKRGLEVRW